MYPHTLQDKLSGGPRKFGGVQRPQMGAALSAAMVAGLVFLVAQYAVEHFANPGATWTLFHMTAALAMGTEALQSKAAFDWEVVVTALSIHAGLSAIYGVILSQILIEVPRRAAVFAGIGAGLLIYAINLHGFTGLFPWFADLRGWATLANHVIFGAVLAGMYWVFHSDKREALRM